MNRDDVLSLARAAGIEVHPRKEIARIGMDELTGCDSTDKLVRFAELAIARHIDDSEPAPIAADFFDMDRDVLAGMLANPKPMTQVDGYVDRDDLLRMVRAAGFQAGWAELWDGQFLTFAALAAGAERAARIEAQQRLAELQEQLVRADAERCAAVAEEREACAKILVVAASTLLMGKRTNAVDRHVADVLDQKAAEIRARGAA